MVVILNFCLKVYYFIVISGRGGPHVGGHLFNPPTHRHKRGCLRTPTVLRIKFSKKNHAFPKGHHLCFFLMPFQKNFPKKFSSFSQRTPLLFLQSPFLKKIQKIFHIFSRRVIIFLCIYISISFFYYRFIKNKISTTINFRNAYIRILYKLLYSFIIYLFAFIFYYFCIRR